MNKKIKKLEAVDFFCSGGGMTSGFLKAGIKVLGGVDIDLDCKKTYEENNKGAKFVHADIKFLTFSFLQKKLKIRQRDNNLVFIGCSPCQFWSKIKTDKTKAQESKNLLEDFQRFVEYFKPGYVVIENVPGIINRFDESPLKSFLKFLDIENYIYAHDVINASHYGVPQSRKRFLLIASRVNKKVSLPIPNTMNNLPSVRNFIGNIKKFKKVSDGHLDNTHFLHTTAKLSESNKKRLALTPHNGGTRMAYAFDKDIAIKSHFNTKNFSDSYGRMYWHKPAPTLTTRFNSISNGRFAHPEQDRGLSLREGATLQTFDVTYKFFGKNQGVIARQIGNAVPPRLAKEIAASILNYD